MSTSIEQVVMRRVRTVRTLQFLTSGAVVAPLLLAASLYAIGRLVFVAQVVRNMPSSADVVALARFFTSAFLHAEFLVQAFTALAALAFAWTVRDFFKTVAVYRMA